MKIIKAGAVKIWNVICMSKSYRLLHNDSWMFIYIYIYIYIYIDMDHVKLHKEKGAYIYKKKLHDLF
jgi:hypothetical protein